MDILVAVSLETKGLGVNQVRTRALAFKTLQMLLFDIEEEFFRMRMTEMTENDGDNSLIVLSWPLQLWPISSWDYYTVPFTGKKGWCLFPKHIETI